MKQNPCKDCIIRSMCTSMCDPKIKYSNNLMDEFTKLCKHIYSKNGYIKKNIPKSIRDNVKAYRKQCKINNKEIQTILERSCHVPMW
jgi:hypothetical protein